MGGRRVNPACVERAISDPDGCRRTRVDAAIGRLGCEPCLRRTGDVRPGRRLEGSRKVTAVERANVGPRWLLHNKDCELRGCRTTKLATLPPNTHWAR